MLTPDKQLHTIRLSYTNKRRASILGTTKRVLWKSKSRFIV